MNEYMEGGGEELGRRMRRQEGLDGTAHSFWKGNGPIWFQN